MCIAAVAKQNISGIFCLQQDLWGGTGLPEPEVALHKGLRQPVLLLVLWELRTQFCFGDSDTLHCHFLPTAKPYSLVPALLRSQPSFSCQTLRWLLLHPLTKN